MQKPQYPTAASYYEVRPSASSGLSPSPKSAPPRSNVVNGDGIGGDAAVQGSNNMAATLQHIVGQLEIITRTLSVLEERISLNEDRIADVTKMQKELLQHQRQQHIRKSYDYHED
jgi:centriolar protein POC1